MADKMSGFDDYLDQLPSSSASRGGNFDAYLDHVENQPSAATQKPESGSAYRGLKESFQQLPQLGYGAMAGVGAAAENVFGEGGISTGIKKAGMAGYKDWGDKIAIDSKESDSWDYSYDKAKQGDFGALQSWLAHGLGYVSGQAIQTLATGGIGSVAGKFVAGTAAKQIAEGMVAKEVAKLTAQGATGDLAKQATANVAGKFAAIGQKTALGANAVGMEGGEIFGDLTSQNPDRVLSGAELGKAFAATLAAGGLEFVGDKLGLDIMLGKSALLKPASRMPGIGGRVARGTIAGTAAAPIEGATEYGQTMLEEYGKGNDPLSEASLKQARESAALGVLGGAAVGVAGGAIHGAKPGQETTTAVLPVEPITDTRQPNAITGILDTINQGETVRQQQATQMFGADNGLLTKMPSIAEIGAARTADEAIAAASRVLSTQLTANKEKEADSADRSQLVETEQRDINTMRALALEDFAKQEQLDQIQAAGTGQYGIRPEQRPAVEQAAALEAPTAMQLAMQRAREKATAQTEPQVPVIPQVVGTVPETNISEPATLQPSNDIRAGDVTRNDGQPFLTESGARLKQRYSGGTDGSDIIAVANGFVVRPKSQEAREEASTATSEAPERGLTVPQKLNVTFGGKTYQVESVEDAQRKWVAFRDASGAGGSEIGNGVRILDQDGNFVARVSYNGRIWNTEDAIGKPRAPEPVNPVDQRLVPLSKRAPTAEQIHAIADAKGIKWDDDQEFMALTKEVTGKERIDDLDPEQRTVLAARIKSEPNRKLIPVSKRAQKEQGKVISRYVGKFGKGMNKDAARLEASRLNRTDKNVTYSAEEHGDPALENPYAVVGRSAESSPKQTSVRVEKLVGPTKTHYVVIKKGERGGEEHTYYATESEANADARGSFATRSPGPQGAFGIGDQAKPVSTKGEEQSSELGLKVQKVIDRRNSDSIVSADEALRRQGDGSLKQIEDRAGFCFRLAAEASAAGLGDMVIGETGDGTGGRIWHAVVMRDGAIYDPTFGQWFEPGVYEALGFESKKTLTPENVRDFIKSSGGFAPDSRNQGLSESVMFARSAEETTAEQNALEALSKNDSLFQVKRSDKTTLADVAFDIKKGTYVRTLSSYDGRTNYTITLPDGHSARVVERAAGSNDFYGYSSMDADPKTKFTKRPGENPQDAPVADDVWIDVSLFAHGEGGGVVYSMASDYAHNTGRIFIGDPASLSDEGLRRRPEQMLSSALKWGTTRHLAPHPRQTVGDKKQGIPALRWVYGDDLGNIERLIDLNLQMSENAGADAITFDPETGQFHDSENKPISRKGINALAEAGYGRNALAGGSTLARGAILRSLVRGESEAGRGTDGRPAGLLQNLLRLASVHAKAVEDTFYARTVDNRPRTTVAALQQAIRDTTGSFLRNSLGRVVATTSSEIKSTWEPLIGSVNIESEGNAGEAQAFFDPPTKTVFLLADRIAKGEEQAVLVHELLHAHGVPVLGKDGWDKLHGVISTWKQAQAGSMERAVYDDAAAKVEAIGAELSNQELFPYAVQAAMNMGVKPNALAKQGTVEKWLSLVRQALKDTWAKITGKPETFDAQDLVNLAFGIAQRENNPGLTLRGTTDPVATNKDVVGNNQGGRSADDISPGVTDTPAFRDWFDGSKIVDENGQPLVVYHGTDVEFDNFDKSLSKNKKNTIGGEVTAAQAYWFTGSWRVAQSFANEGVSTPKGFLYPGKRVISTYLSMKNPLIIDMAKVPLTAKEREWTFPSTDTKETATEIGFRKETDARRALANGHDGLVYINGFDGNFYAGRIYAVFDKSQIKIKPNESPAPDSGGAQFSRAAIVGQTSRQHTSAQLRAMKAVGFQTEAPTMKERAQALWKDAGKKLAQGIVDQFAPVKALDKEAYGLLRLAKGASGAFEAFLHGGKLKLTDNVYDFDDTDKGGVIDKLLIPLQGEHHDLMRWVAANRAERLQGEGKENLFTQQDISDLKTLASGTTGFDYTVQTGPAAGRVTRDRTLIYADAQRVFNGFNKNILDMAEQSGLIDGASRHLWEHEFYVPFYRVADDSDGGIRGANIKGGVVRQEAFKALKGGKNALNSDLLENTLLNWAHLLDASAKNRAAKATIEAAERMGVASPGNQSTLAQMATSINNKHGVVWFMDGGQKRYSLVDDPYIMTALTSLEYAGMRNPVMNAMSTFKHALTIGVTASPFFKIRNLIRDSVQVLGTSSIKPNPVANIAQGWKLTDPKSDAYFRLLAGGGTIHFGTMMEGSEAKRVQSLVEAGVDDATLLNNQHKVKQFYRKFIEPGITAYNELGNRGEAINRASLYAQLTAQGMNHAEASLQARDLMDFSMNGSFTTIRFLTQTVPFLNARLQGLYKLGRAAKEDPARFAAVIGVAAVMAISLAAAYGDDPDWKKRTEDDRNNYYWFKFGGVAFRIPRPFEIGAIATLAERTFELAFEKEMTNERFRKQVINLLGDNLSMNPIPQLVKPIMEVYANKNSFTGAPIESMGQERLKSEYRFNDRTSMAARGASTALNSVSGLIGEEALSPVQIDHMLRGYFGWLGAFVVGVGDVVARTGQPTQATPDYWKAATGGMVSDLRDAPSRYISAMYDQAKVVERAYATRRQLIKEGKFEEAAEFAKDHNEELIRYKSIERVKRQEANLNERRRMVERSNLDADTKRATLRMISEQQNRVAMQ